MRLLSSHVFPFPFVSLFLPISLPIYDPPPLTTHLFCSALVPLLAILVQHRSLSTGILLYIFSLSVRHLVPFSSHIQYLSLVNGPPTVLTLYSLCVPMADIPLPCLPSSALMLLHPYVFAASHFPLSWLLLYLFNYQPYLPPEFNLDLNIQYTSATPFC